MNSKRLWAATAAIFALSVLDPRSSGVWAATRAMCLAGWEWVRSVHVLFVSEKTTVRTFLGRSRVDCTPLQNQNSLGQDPCVVVSALDAACYGDSACACK